MRKIIIFSTILILLQPFKLPAQKAYAIDKGSTIIGGSLSCTSTGSEYKLLDRVQTITITPGLLFFIFPHLAIGGEVQFISTVYPDYSLTSYGSGPAIRYYFGKTDSKEFPFLSFSHLRSTENGWEYSIRRRQFLFSVGSAIMIARNVAIEPKAFFSITKVKKQKDSNTYGLELGISTFIF
jgi:hypothetical protein